MRLMGFECYGDFSTVIAKEAERAMNPGTAKRRSHGTFQHLEIGSE
jgi:hypothetical protein